MTRRPRRATVRQDTAVIIKSDARPAGHSRYHRQDGTPLLRWMRAEDNPSRLPARLFWTGFLLRVAYITLAHTFRIRVILDHFQFGWEMGRIARALATGHGFADPFNGHSGPTAWTPPLYPLLLAAVFKLFGVYTLKSAWVILSLNSVFSAATAPLVYEIAWRCFGRDAKGLKVALWSGWLWALYPAAMQYAVHWVWDMALTAFLFSWVLVLALRVRASRRPRRNQPPKSNPAGSSSASSGASSPSPTPPSSPSSPPAASG